MKPPSHSLWRNSRCMPGTVDLGLWECLGHAGLHDHRTILQALQKLIWSLSTLWLEQWSIAKARRLEDKTPYSIICHLLRGAVVAATICSWLLLPFGRFWKSPLFDCHHLLKSKIQGGNDRNTKRHSRWRCHRGKRSRMTTWPESKQCLMICYVYFLYIYVIVIVVIGFKYHQYHPLSNPNKKVLWRYKFHPCLTLKQLGNACRQLRFCWKSREKRLNSNLAV